VRLMPGERARPGLTGSSWRDRSAWGSACRTESGGTWRSHVPAERLFACAWGPVETLRISEAGVRPVLVLRDLEDDDAVLGRSEGPKGFSAWRLQALQAKP
jgi:hypothetical protein